MAIAGKVMMRPMGDYNASTSYEILDLVNHNNVLWICKLSGTIGVEPSETNTTNWQVVVDNFGLPEVLPIEKGGTGANSVEGIRSSLGIEQTIVHKNATAAMPEHERWSSIAYGDGKFIAVAYNSSKAACSTDGLFWNINTIDKYGAGSEDITYGDGKFVAVGQSSASCSTDGVNWTSTNLDYQYLQLWRTIAYGDGKFVAAGAGNKIAYSTDGITWNYTDTNLQEYYIRKLIYADGKFVALTYTVVDNAESSSDKILYSTDAINWTSATLPSSYQIFGLAYGNGKFVAPIFSSNKVLYSTDCVVWQESSIPVNASWWSIVYGDNKFVIATNNGNIVYSVDGLVWSSIVRLKYNQVGHALCYGDGKFIVAGSYSNNNYLLYSTDGINWTDEVKGLFTLDGEDITKKILDDILTDGLTINQEWGGYYIKDNSGRDAFMEKNSNSGAVNIGNIVNSDNTQYLTINPETTSLDMALTLTRNVNGVSVTYRIPVEEITQ